MTSFRIRLVEDEPQTAQMVRFYLEREGFAVSQARDGPSGEAVFRTEQPHLVILDLMLPGFDGLEERAPTFAGALCVLTLETSHFPHIFFTSSPSPFGILHLRQKQGQCPQTFRR